MPVCPAAALKELMTAPVPHPQRGAHNIWHEDHVERMGGQERLARLRGILPEYAAEEPGWTGALQSAPCCNWGLRY